MSTRDNYGEFKGSTNTKLENLSSDIGELKNAIKDLQKSVDELNGYKYWTMGIGAAAGFLAGLFKDAFIKT